MKILHFTVLISDLHTYTTKLTHINLKTKAFIVHMKNEEQALKLKVSYVLIQTQEQGKLVYSCIYREFNFNQITVSDLKIK